MAVTRSAAVAAVLVLALAGALAYLRDPPWLADLTTGIHAEMVDVDGRRARWLDGRSSFFVPSDARAVRLPIRTTFDTPQEWPVQVTVSVDGHQTAQVVLRDADWRILDIRLPPRGARRHCRIDIHLDRLRAERRGALLGEIELR
jgi:hypothetical protein